MSGSGWSLRRKLERVMLEFIKNYKYIFLILSSKKLRIKGWAKKCLDIERRGMGVEVSFVWWYDDPG
jgi:hypothetical protein